MADGVRLGVDDATDGAPDSRLTIGVADLAREVVAATAPEQLELLAAVTARWESSGVPGRGRWAWLGGSVGYGVASTVTSEIIYPLLTGTLGQVLGTAAVAGWRRSWWRRRGVPPVPQVRVTLDGSQIEAFRSACVDHGMALGLSRPKATILAEASYGALCRAVAEPRPLA